MTKLPLSTTRKIGNILFISGQIGQENGQLVSENLEDQTIQTIKNLKKVLEENNLTIKNIIDVTVFLVDQGDYDAFNEIYAKEFEEPYPTRTTVTVKSLPLNAKIELKTVASLI